MGRVPRKGGVRDGESSADDAEIPLNVQSVRADKT